MAEYSLALVNSGPSGYGFISEIKMSESRTSQFYTEVWYLWPGVVYGWNAHKGYISQGDFNSCQTTAQGQAGKWVYDSEYSVTHKQRDDWFLRDYEGAWKRAGGS